MNVVTVTQPATTVTVDATDVQVRVTEQATRVIVAPGVVSGTPPIRRLTGATLSGHRALTLDSMGRLVYADALTAPYVTGINADAALPDELLTVYTSGVLAESSWNWTIGPVWLGLNGLLTQTPPVTGALVQVGYAPTATQLVVQIERPLFF